MTFVKKRMTGYALIIFICLLTSPVLTVIGTQLHSDAGVNIFKIVDLFDFMPPLLNWTPIYSFGYSVLPYRFFKTGFFAFLAITVITRFIYKNYRLSSKIAAPASLFISGLMLFLYVQPASIVTLGLNPYNGCHADQHYYNGIDEIYEEKVADFNIISYKLDFIIKNELTAAAEIQVSAKDLCDFQFTLYHGYVITKITNEKGEELRFTQKSDYVTVYSNKNLEKLIMYYHGSAPRFFANRQGVSLPGYFPFYPQKGFRNIYNKDEYGFDKFTQTDTYSFDVSVDSKKKVYCNLAKTGDNTFSGISNSLTLVSGLYDSYIHNNIEIVYPYMLIDKGAAADESFTMDKMLSEADKFLTNRLDGKDIKRIICVANMNNASPFERLCVYSDHITAIALNSLDYYYENQRFSGDKRRLYEYIDIYKNMRQAYDTRLDMAKSEKSEQAKLIVLLDEKIKLLGETPVIEKAAEYFNSEDNRSAFEFLESLR
ncbi:MAG: hypothetical protein GX848_06300 [Clostridiales bacterium]|nr:hypothetical protein [Clostridiales bacterium]